MLSDLVAMRRECDAAFTAALGIGDSATRREIVSRMSTVFETVQSLGTTRDQLKKFGYGHKYCTQIYSVAFTIEKPIIIMI